MISPFVTAAGNRNESPMIREAFPLLKSTFNNKELTRLFHGLCYVVYLQAQQNPDQSLMQKQARLYLQHTLNIS